LVPTVNAEVAKQSVIRGKEGRMDTHKNAPLTPKGREAMLRSIVEGGLTKAAAARLRFKTDLSPGSLASSTSPRSAVESA
jgi:hypothetical protein